MNKISFHMRFPAYVYIKYFTLFSFFVNFKLNYVKINFSYIVMKNIQHNSCTYLFTLSLSSVILSSKVILDFATPAVHLLVVATECYLNRNVHNVTIMQFIYSSLITIIKLKSGAIKINKALCAIAKSHNFNSSIFHINAN